MVETLDAIKERRSVRNFKSDPLEKDVIKDILNCGHLAPSAKNKQPWKFVVLTKPETKNKIADMMIEYYNNNKQEEENRYGFASSVYPTALIIKQAPVLILIMREKDDNWIVGDNLSIGACVENMCLRATDLGLGSLWIRDVVYVAQDVAEMIGHGNLELNCCLCLGKPNDNKKSATKKPIDDLVEWYDK